MAEIRFDNGKVVKLSEETIKRLRKELIRDDTQLKVGRFRAIYSPDSDGLRMMIIKYGDEIWDGGWNNSVCFLTTSQVREIIAGLSRMIGE